MTVKPPIAEEYEPREDRLPEWVRRKLGLLRQRITEERKASAALRGDVGETDTLIRYYDIRPDHPLPSRSEISFVPDLARPHQEIACKLRDGELKVHGTKGLILRPISNNGLIIKLED
jgi:hypothetical protein